MADQFSLPAAQGLVDEAKEIADYVIIDSPPLDRGDRRAAARADDRRRRDRRAARPHPHRPAAAPRRDARPVPHPARRLRAWSASARRASTATTHRAPGDDLGRAPGRRVPTRYGRSRMASLRGSRRHARTQARRVASPPWREDRPRRCVSGSASALLALGVGVLAGIDPQAGDRGRVRARLRRARDRDITVGLCLFVVVSFLEVLSNIGGRSGITKVIGLLLAMSWLADRLDPRRAPENDFVAAHPTIDLPAGDVRRVVRRSACSGPSAPARRSHSSFRYVAGRCCCS